MQKKPRRNGCSPPWGIYQAAQYVTWLFHLGYNYFVILSHMKHYVLISAILSLLVIWMIISNAWAAGTDPRDDNLIYEERRKKTFKKKSKEDHVIRKNLKYFQIRRNLP